MQKTRLTAGLQARQLTQGKQPVGPQQQRHPLAWRIVRPQVCRMTARLSSACAEQQALISPTSILT